jgi:YHS domain-containing protein
MKSKTGAYIIVLVAAAALLTAMITSQGCKKKEPAPTTLPQPTSEAPAVTIEQTTCPVLAGPVNKEIFTEYKGKKVYFCCPVCKEKFEADPEKYISKLPQFQK